MKALEDKIIAEGKILPGNILMVGNFLNQQIDVDFIMEMGRTIASMYKDTGVNKILTIEASGIAIATAVAACMHVPVVFAKKKKTGNLSGDTYESDIHSYTTGSDCVARVSKEFLNSSDKVLIIDDFLAYGSAVRALMDIAGQAGAEVKGVSVAIEKGYQGGGDELRAKGIRVDSMAIIESMDADNGQIIYRAVDN